MTRDSNPAARAAELYQAGRLAECVDAYRLAIADQPMSAALYNNLGAALRSLGRLQEAQDALQSAVKLQPTATQAWSNLGNVRRELGDLDTALAAHRRSIELQPDNAESFNNLAVAQEDAGDLDAALDSYRRAVDLAPGNPRLHSNLIYAMHFSPAYDAGDLLAAHLAWNARHAAAIAATHPAPPLGDWRHRRIRVGYVSPNFSDHSVGRFLLPLFAHHDRSAVEVFAYSDVLKPDATTAMLRSQVDIWCDISTLDDAAAADQIRRDGIDVLIDLTMHMARNRLLMFARRPAPVQASYLAYVSTTGVDGIDYRLTDATLDPSGSESAYHETSIALPTYWCYAPSAAAEAAPERTQNGITFGCLNHLAKASAPARTAWRRILQATPGSRLILHARRGSHREQLLAEFEADGIARERIELIDFLPMANYLATYRRIDIALDPFPYGGGTTSCDALWMGTPVVTLRGRTAVGRGTASLLTTVGLKELIASSIAEYVAVASALVADDARLKHLQQSLRDQVRRSPLHEGLTFARSFESAVQHMLERRSKTSR